MKVLICTNKLQRQRKSDFCHTEENEVAYFGMECDRDKLSGPDGGCGCRRSFCGMHSKRATTTVEVVDMPITEQHFVDAYVKANEDWLSKDDDGSLRALFIEEAKEVLKIASNFPVGSVVEKRGRAIQVRHPCRVEVARR